jgi:tRNA wybutosine-synthesizing protein 2
MRVRKIAREDLLKVCKEDWVDPRRRPSIKGDTAFVPVRDEFPSDCELSERELYSGRGFFMLGDVAVIHGEAPSQEQIGRIVTFRNPRGILWIRSLRDHTRTPDARVLFGNVGEVRHHENGYTYILDPCTVMFAQGNREEKKRIADLVRSARYPERVADMFAGIGYFTIPMAGSGAHVHAMEINPLAFGYLQRNLIQNRLIDRVQATCGDCRDILYGVYDRIVMGHFEAICMLPQALNHVKSESVIHLHSLGSVEEKIHSCLSSAGFCGEVTVHKVKKYRPHIWHMVQDVVIA